MVVDGGAVVVAMATLLPASDGYATEKGKHE